MGLPRATILTAALLAMLPLTACKLERVADDRPETARAFPLPHRPVARPGANSFSTETARDDRGEAITVMDLAKITPGMTVADIGAGEGYYTVRLAERVGAKGRVLAQDIDHDALKRLGLRVERERLDNVAIKPGRADDPALPAASFDRIFLVHMYHEVTEPYAFLWRLRDALKPGRDNAPGEVAQRGQVIVVDVDRPTSQHGIPPELLFCEFDAVGYRLAAFVRKPEIAGYYARFEATGAKPAPGAIRPCRMQNNGDG